MRLYLANISRQRQRFFYRKDLDASGNPVSQLGVTPLHVDIAPGHQEQVGGDLSEAQANSIIKQAEIYGGIHCDDVNRLTDKTTFLYSKDLAISKARIEKCHQHNLGVLTKEGAKRRQAAAIASATVIDSDEVKVTLEQQEESEAGPGRLEEGYTVDKVNDKGRGGSRRGARARTEARP